MAATELGGSCSPGSPGQLTLFCQHRVGVLPEVDPRVLSGERPFPKSCKVHCRAYMYLPVWDVEKAFKEMLKTKNVIKSVCYSDGDLQALQQHKQPNLICNRATSPTIKGKGCPCLTSNSKVASNPLGHLLHLATTLLSMKR